MPSDDTRQSLFPEGVSFRAFFAAVFVLTVLDAHRRIHRLRAAEPGGDDAE